MSEISQKQLEANRTNAKLGGVKTPEGKAVSSQNAIKHGLYAKALIINTGLIKESEEEFNTLLDDFNEALHPENKLQEELVYIIAVCAWKHRRAIIAESGEIRKLNDNLKFNYEKQKRIEKEQRQISWTLSFQEVTTEEKHEALDEVEKTLNTINAMIDELDATQDLNSLDIKPLYKLFGTDEDPFLVGIYYSKEHSSLSNPERVRNVLSLLRKKQETLQDRFDELSEVDKNNQVSKSMSNLIPTDIDRILRYINSIDKQMKNALEMLRMLQNHNAPQQQ